MPIRAVILDVEGTLLLQPGQPQRGVSAMLRGMRDAGLSVAVAANKTEAEMARWLRGSRVDPDLVLCPATVGQKKPSPEFVYKACSDFGIGINEIIYVGDSDRTDAITAANAKTLYLSAGWSGHQGKYGVPVKAPQSVIRFIRVFLLRQPVWYWSCGRQPGEGPYVRTLIDGNGAGSRDTKNALLGLLKDGRDTTLPSGASFAGFVLHYLLTTLYLDGIYSTVDWWATYPGHAAGSAAPPVVQRFYEMASKLFRDAYRPQLLVRHTDAPKSAFLRAQGKPAPFSNQVTTVCLNPEDRARLRGKTVLVIDDFCTDGHAFEWSRELLMRAGAAGVVAVAIGRYGSTYEKRSLSSRHSLDPFGPSTLADSDFATAFVQRDSQELALQEFVAALQRYTAT
jgi:hypothetical protein